MHELTEKLCSKVSSKTLGILWVTDQGILEFPWAFEALDYLFDGLLGSFYSYQAKRLELEKSTFQTRRNLFSSINFGRLFFLCHIQYSKNNFATDMQESLKLFEPVTDRNRVLVVSQKKNLVIDDFKNFSFHDFSLD